MVDSEKGSLEEEALKRQQRLKQLKRKRTDKPDENGASKTTFETLPIPKFRSYKPQDKNLGENVSANALASNVQGEVKHLLDLAKGEMVIDQLDIAALAPRRPDWDLKRDVAKKLEKLERRTQKAMAELIRDRLKERQDLAEIANAPADSYSKLV